MGVGPRAGSDVALGGEDEHLVGEHVDLERVDIVLGVGVLLVSSSGGPTRIPPRCRAGDALLVFPVGGDAVLGDLVHLPGADLHLEGDALGADDRGVQALVAVGLGVPI
jgi:hypothetical protein